MAENVMQIILVAVNRYLAKALCYFFIVSMMILQFTILDEELHPDYELCGASLHVFLNSAG